MNGKTMGRLAEALRYSAIWYLEKAEYAKLTDEEDRNVKTFWALEKSVVDIPPAWKRDPARAESENTRTCSRTIA